MPRKEKRISFALPAVPYSLKAFIEKAVKDERTMLTFVESPRLTLETAGVPLKTDCLTESDFRRLQYVLGKLRNLVAQGKLARDFRFEEIFSDFDQVAYQKTHSETEAYIEKNFDHSTEGSQMEHQSHTEEGITKNFGGFPAGRIPEVTAPLMSSGDLATIAARIQAEIESSFEG